MAIRTNGKESKIVNYLIFGSMTTVLNITLYSVLIRINSPYMLSNLIAFCVALLFAYFTNKKWVFNASEEKEEEKKESEEKEAEENFEVKEFSKFVLARVTTLILESVLLYLGITLLRLNPYGVKMITTINVVTMNYLLSKLLVFKK